MPLFASLALVLQVTAGQPAQRFDVQGHRGARGLLPENTTAGFLRAVDLGVVTLELDVVVAADSTVVVSHEPWMSDTICSDVTGRAITHGRSHNIYGMTYEAVARYDCGSRGHPNFPRQERMSAAKPRLADVIDSVETHVARLGIEPTHYNIEIKSRPEWDSVYTPVPPVFVRLVHGVVAASDVLDRTTIQSFDIRSLDAARQLGAAWQLALLTEPGTNLRSALARLGFTPHIYSPSFQAVDEPMVQAAHALGMRLIPWTVNSVTDMVRLHALGVDGIITDYPDLARAVSDF